MINKFNSIFVTLFGIGKIKYAPGTFASIWTATVLFYLFHILKLSNFIIFIILFVIFLYSFYAITNYISKKDNKDPKEIVIDEFIGQSIPIYLYEISHNVNKESGDALFFYIYIFLLFRFFDIKKPFPINFFDKNFKNSFGVVFDDVIAGLYTVITLILFMIIKSKIV
jgi:phosphatidylglycerophosphatase A